MEQVQGENKRDLRSKRSKKKGDGISHDNGWDSALNFLKVQNEQALKFKDTWKKEKQAMKVRFYPLFRFNEQNHV